MRSSLCIFLLFLSIQIQATHIIGGSLTYECLGNDEYKFTLTVLRDCNPPDVDFDSGESSFVQGTVSLFEGDNLLRNILLNAPSIEDIILDTYFHPCFENLNLCIERGIYEFTSTLPKSDNSYTVTYQRCCRTPRIINIFNPSETGMTFTVDLNVVSQEQCNSSPLFLNQQNYIACVNDPLNIDFSAADKEGDELRYFLCSPLLGGGLAGTTGQSGSLTDLDGLAPNPDAPPPYININFNEAGYSFLQPFGNNSNIQLDSITGILTGIVPTIGSFAYGICIEEYRSGELLSTVRKDAIMNVVDCNPTSACDLISIRDTYPVEHFKIFPNPTTNEFSIVLEQGSISEIKLFDLNGRILEGWSRHLDLISLQNYSSGVFIVEVKDNAGNIFRSKVVKTAAF